MLTAFIILTDNCNLNCSYCINNKTLLSQNSVSLKLNDYLNIIDILNDNGVTDIIFTGGEPLLYKDDVKRIVEKCNHYNMNTLLLTNGKVLNNELIKNLKDAGLTSLCVSLNELSTLSVVDDNFNLILKDYETIVDAVLQHFSYTSVTALITNKNYNVLGSIFKKFDIEKVGFIFQPVHDKNLALDSLDENEWKKLKLNLYEWTVKFNKYNYLQTIYNFYNDIDAGDIECPMGTYAFVINSAGNVYNCFHRKDMFSGNILNDDPQKLFTNLISNSVKTIDGNCFGEHCISLFFNVL